MHGVGIGFIVKVAAAGNKAVTVVKTTAFIQHRVLMELLLLTARHTVCFPPQKI